jgi:hypothetical protein
VAKQKRQPPKSAWNVHHPELVDKIEPAFKSNGVQYYNFIKDTNIRTGRYMILQNFLQEVYFRMSLERLKLYIDKITNNLNGTLGVINIGNALELLTQMKHLSEMAFEPDTVYRLASVVYFDETEDLRTWDKTINDKKIKAWKENGTLDFFYGRPFQELTGLKGISETDLKHYLEKWDDLKEKYNSVIPML